MPKSRSVNLVVIGPTGTVGNEFMKLVESGGPLFRRHGLKVEITGTMRSSGIKTIYRDGDGHHGLTREQWTGLGSADLGTGTFLRYSSGPRVGRNVLVDLSTIEHGDYIYKQAFGLDFAGVVTVNKRSLVVSHERFRQLHQAARDNKARLLTGATIGAGLQTPRELHDLAMRGETFQAVEVVLGGSIAFIVDRFQNNPHLRFSDAVRQAKDLGYLDPPNPFIDLSGTDVRWKLLLLVRSLLPQIERSVNLEHMKVKPVLRVPRNYARLHEATAMPKIEAQDAAMNQLRRQANRAGTRLRYVGSISPDGNGSAELLCVPRGHPAFDLTGSTNMVSIVDQAGCRKTITGAGAGPALTARAAFRDFLEVAGVCPEYALA